MRPVIALAALALAACGGAGPSGTAGPGDNAAVVKVTGELQSANSYFFGPPAIAT